jgi:hypothetical protein
MATSTANGKSKSKAKQRPVHELRMGRIRAAIWENQTDNGIRHNATFTRLYKDESDQWKDSASFGRDDFLLLAKLADQVHSWVFEQTGTARDSEVTEEVAF